MNSKRQPYESSIDRPDASLSADRDHDLLDSLPAAIYTTDARGKITYYNQAAALLWGCEPKIGVDEWCGAAAVRCPDGTPLPIEQWPMVLALKESRSLSGEEIIVERPDGTRRCVLAYAQPIFDRAGAVIGASNTLINVADTYDARRALGESEEQLAQEVSALQELHQMTARLLGLREIPEALAEVLDSAMRIQKADCGKVQVYNPEQQALELVAHRGFPQESLEYFRLVLRDHESASGIALRLKQRVIIEDVESYKDYPINRKVAALTGYRAAQATPLLSRSGELLGMLSTHFRRPHRPTERELRILDLYARQAADFIEVLRIEQGLRQSEDHLRQQALDLEEQLIASGRMVSLGEITASMAHEFNNPLGIILGFAQDLLSSTEQSNPDVRALQIIEEEARRCRRIVQDLIDFSRPQPTELIPTKADEVITRSLSLVESSLYKRKIAVETALMPNLPKIPADPQQLQQVLLNVLLNAIDAMPAGGKLSVTASVEQKNRESVMMITISDSGAGIEKELQSKIFLPFFTAGKKHGLGLGLSICNRIVKNHHGTIEVESQPGKGTTFKICLPLSHQSADLTGGS